MIDTFFEKEKYKNNLYKRIGGVDEAGRGALAGPVVAACVVVTKEDVKKIKNNKKFLFLRDSKKISVKKRELLFGFIKEYFIYGIGVVESDEIDKNNILQASFSAMRIAIAAIDPSPDFIFVDGNMKIPELETSQATVVGGDDLVFSIAAASVLAKVTRDAIMNELSKKYPSFNLAKNKGYGTKDHLEAIKDFGFSEVHRKSFSPIKEML